MKIDIPTSCPCCHYPLAMISLQLFCKNPACGAQISKKLEHFTKVLGIKGFGPATINKLDLADITEIFYLDRDSLVDSLGSEKVADKLLAEIDRARGADLATVLASFSIPLLGETASKKIASAVSDITEINHETCKLAGLGDKVTANLLDWISTEYQELKEFLPFSFKSVKSREQATNGKTVCITGKLTSFKTKSEATTKLTEAGYVVVEAVTKTTTYLVDEQNNGSSKRLKADKYGIVIIDNLNNFLKESTHE